MPPEVVSDEQRRREEHVTAQVLASFGDAGNERLSTVMRSLVTHLHEFMREVRLTSAEWQAAIEFLRAAGEITTDRRDEFVLASDVLGASMQMITINNREHGDATEATVLGPFFVEESPMVPRGGDIAAGAAGEPCWVEGSVTDTSGRPIPHARLEVWECDEEGLYDVQRGDGHELAARAHLFTDDAGEYAFWGLTPTAYPIPHDGPVGRLLASAGRSPMRAPHLHFMVSAPGRRTLITHIFVADGPFLDSDAVFGVRPSLVKRFERQPTGAPTPDGRELGGQAWSRVRFDIVLAPSEASDTLRS